MVRLIISLVLFLAINLYAGDCICYYFNYDVDNAKTFFKPTCEYYSIIVNKLLNEQCEIQPFSNVLLLPIQRKDIIIIVGEGNPEGLFLTHSDNVTNGYQGEYIYKWKDLAKDLKANIAIIDACYPGYIFDYEHPNVNYLITTAYKENSWNIIDKDGKNVSSFSAALRCKYDDSYNCPIAGMINNPCKDENINQCQGHLIMNSLSRWGWDVFWYDWEYPSMGTCYVNGKPCLWR